MRKLVWIAAGFGTAAFLSEYVLPIPGLPYIAAALAVCALVFLPRKCRRPRAALLLFSAAADRDTITLEDALAKIKIYGDRKDSDILAMGHVQSYAKN